MSRIRKISSRSARGVGFSNGWAELALKNPPPLVPRSLMASCEATGPPTTDCVPPVRVVLLGAGGVLHRPAEHQDQRADDGQRQQDRG